MTSVLSQEEIDALLRMFDAASGGGEETALAPARDARMIKIYDFKRPDKFSRAQIRCVSMMHEIFARSVTAALSHRLGKRIHVHVASVDQLTYEEFIRSVPLPTTMGVIDMGPLNGKAIMEIDPCVTFSIIDRLLGGEGERLPACHELTSIERFIMGDVIVKMLASLKGAWANVIDLSPGLSQIETNPQFAQFVYPYEMTLLVTLEVCFGETEGMINLCIPYSTIEPIADRFSAAYWYGNKKPPAKNYKLAGVEDVPVNLTAEILRRAYSVSEIASWKGGSHISHLASLAPNYCYLRLGGRRVWQCEILNKPETFRKKIKIVKLECMPFCTEGKMNVGKPDSQVFGALSTADMTISVELGSASMLVKDILALDEGSIVELDKLAGEPADIKANGTLIAKGEVVVIDENFGVRIVEIAGKPGGGSGEGELK